MSDIRVASGAAQAWEMVPVVRPQVLITDLKSEGYRSGTAVIERMLTYWVPTARATQKTPLIAVLVRDVYEESLLDRLHGKVNLVIRGDEGIEDLRGAILKILLVQGEMNLSSSENLSIGDAMNALGESSSLLRGGVEKVFDTLVQQGEFEKAYMLARRAHPSEFSLKNRLEEMLRLAVQTQHFVDVEDFYRIYVSLEERSASLTRTLLAALWVAIKHSLSKGDTEAVARISKNLMVSSGGDLATLEKLIFALVESRQPSLARDALKRYPVTENSIGHYRALDYLIFDCESSLSESLSRGYQLIWQQIEDPIIYQVLIRRLSEAKKSESAEHLEQLLRRKWPDAA